MIGFWWRGVLAGALGLTFVLGLLVAVVPRWSPLHGDVLLVSAFDPRRCNNSDLLMVDAGRSARRILTPDRCEVFFGAAWSPDGVRFAYSSLFQTQMSLYIGAIGQPAEPDSQFAQGTTTITAAGWSPDGARLVYDYDTAGTALVAIYDAASNEHTRYTDPVFSSRAMRQAWSADGDSVLILMARDGRDFRMGIIDTTTGEIAPFLTEYRVSGAAWSPDGEHIAFSAQTARRPEVFISTPHGDAPRNISNSNFVDDVPVWSPDGRRLAYLSNRDGGWRLFIYDLQSDETRRLDTGSITPSNALAWSADGARIAFVSERRLYIADVDSGAVTAVDLGDFRISDTFTRFTFRPSS